jgi:hypothetical protein
MKLKSKTQTLKLLNSRERKLLLLGVCVGTTRSNLEPTSVKVSGYQTFISRSLSSTLGPNGVQTHINDHQMCCAALNRVLSGWIKYKPTSTFNFLLKHKFTKKNLTFLHSFHLSLCIFASRLGVFYSCVVE